MVTSTTPLFRPTRGTYGWCRAVHRLRSPQSLVDPAARWRHCAPLHSARVFGCYDGLGVGVLGEAFEAVLDAQAGLLMSAEGNVGREAVDLVDPDSTRLDLLCDSAGEGDVLTPDRRGKAIFGVVGAGDDILDIVELEQRQHRSERLLDHYPAFFGRIVDDRDRHEIALALGDSAAGEEGQSLGVRVREQLLQLLELHLVLNGPQ